MGNSILRLSMSGGPLSVQSAVVTDIPFDIATWVGDPDGFAKFVPASGPDKPYILIVQTNYYNLFGTANFQGSAGGSFRTVYSVISPDDATEAPEPCGTIGPPITVGGPPASPTEYECVAIAVPLTAGDRLRPRVYHDAGVPLDLLVTLYTPVFTIKRAA